MQQTAKLFKNGRSQAVRLPSEFRFEGDEVAIRKDPQTGDVILSSTSDDWDTFFTRRDQIPQEELDQLTFERDKSPIRDSKLFG